MIREGRPRFCPAIENLGAFLDGRGRRALDAVTGTVLVAFGLRIATERAG